MTQQPEALQWAYLLEREANEHGATDYKHKAAAEFRRLHAENERLTNLSYGYLGELTALRAANHMMKQLLKAGVR